MADFSLVTEAAHFFEESFFCFMICFLQKQGKYAGGGLCLVTFTALGKTNSLFYYIVSEKRPQ